MMDLKEAIDFIKNASPSMEVGSSAARIAAPPLPRGPA